MREFFEDIPFTLPQGRHELTTVLSDKLFPLGEEINIVYPNEDLLTLDFDEIVIYEPEIGWDFEKVLVTFHQNLTSLESDLRTVFPMNNRSISLVTPEELIPPEGSDERQDLIDNYGPYILDGIAGDCEQIADGYVIRIGYKDMESATSVDEVIEVVAHEYGHTLGKHIDNTIFEEVKAYSFQALFMRHYLDVDLYLMDGISPDRTHHVARHIVGQITTRGIPEEAALSHLIGEPFGTHMPDDYKKFNKSSVKSLKRGSL